MFTDNEAAGFGGDPRPAFTVRSWVKKAIGVVIHELGNIASENLVLPDTQTRHDIAEGIFDALKIADAGFEARRSSLFGALIGGPDGITTHVIEIVARDHEAEVWDDLAEFGTDHAARTHVEGRQGDWTAADLELLKKLVGKANNSSFLLKYAGEEVALVTLKPKSAGGNWSVEEFLDELNG
jgi:hypothetical protein